VRHEVKGHRRIFGEQVEARVQAEQIEVWYAGRSKGRFPSRLMGADLRWRELHPKAHLSPLKTCSRLIMMRKAEDCEIRIDGVAIIAVNMMKLNSIRTGLQARSSAASPLH
jgi:hypothetical protein